MARAGLIDFGAHTICSLFASHAPSHAGRVVQVVVFQKKVHLVQQGPERGQESLHLPHDRGVVIVAATAPVPARVVPQGGKKGVPAGREL